jgi:hypothetical protein
MWYTISWAERPEMDRNGARGAPFCRWRDGEQAKMVHVVHHFVDGGTANRSEWRTWYTISWAERLKVSQNGACSAPFCRWRDSKQVRMVYVVHHFMGRKAEGEPEWCTWCTVMSMARLQTGQNGACGAPFQRPQGRKWTGMVHVVRRFIVGETGNRLKWCT